MPKFCDNLACHCHVDFPEGREARDMTFITHTGKEVRTSRWPVLRTQDMKQFFFCTTCANVAAMLHSLK